MITTTFTFYRPGKPEHNWHGLQLPAAPRIGDSIHPGDVLGEEYERCWTVHHVRWVYDASIDRWDMEVGLT